MFERYTEKARRVIFFARYEASQLGAPHIETEHVLLGLLREAAELLYRLLLDVQYELIRREVAEHSPFQKATSVTVDLHLSNECKRVLAYAAEEAERLGHRHIGTEHLLLGLLREKKSYAAQLLQEHGANLADMRSRIAELPETGKTLESIRSRGTSRLQNPCGFMVPPSIQDTWKKRSGIVAASCGKYEPSLPPTLWFVAPTVPSLSISTWPNTMQISGWSKAAGTRWRA